jgi:hypothetical protein
MECLNDASLALKLPFWKSISCDTSSFGASDVRNMMLPLDFVVVRFLGPQSWRRLASTLRRRAPSWPA